MRRWPKPIGGWRGWRLRGESAAAAAAWALGAWCASGVIAPEAADASSRIGALAPAWLLAVLLAGALAATAFSRLTARAAAPLWLPLVSVLPWLPVPLPAAAMLAVGALGQVFAVACAVASAMALRAETPWIEAGRPKRAIPGLLLAATLFGSSAWWLSPRIPGGDEPHYLIITQSLLTDGDLRIEDNHRRRDYAAYVEGELKPDYLRRGRDGAIYSVHAPGVSAVILPGFALAGYPGAVVTLVVLGALGLLAVWCASRDLTGNVTAASVATAGVGLSVPFFFQTFTIYPDGPAAVGVAAVVWLALVRPGFVTWQRALACGAVLGALPWLHTRYVAIAAPLGLIVAGRLLWPREACSWPVRARALAALAVPALVSGVAWLSMFQAIYGTWDPRAPYGHATELRWARVPHGVTGLLLDQQFGLLPNAPIYLVALAGIAALWRRDRRLTTELLIATAPYVAVVGGFHMWWGGRSSPARFLVPVLLPLALPMAAWWAHATSRTARAVTLLLLTASVCLTCALVLVDHGALLYNVRDGHALWLLAADPSVNLTYTMPSLFQAGPTVAWIVAVTWFLVAALGWLALRGVERQPAARRSVARQRARHLRARHRLRHEPRVGAVARRLVGFGQRTGRRRGARLRPAGGGCSIVASRCGTCQRPADGRPDRGCVAPIQTRQHAALDGRGRAPRSLSPRRLVRSQRVRNREGRPGTARPDIDVLHVRRSRAGPDRVPDCIASRRVSLMGERRRGDGQDRRTAGDDAGRAGPVRRVRAPRPTRSHRRCRPHLRRRWARVDGRRRIVDGRRRRGCAGCRAAGLHVVCCGFDRAAPRVRLTSGRARGVMPVSLRPARSGTSTSRTAPAEAPCPSPSGRPRRFVPRIWMPPAPTRACWARGSSRADRFDCASG